MELISIKIITDSLELNVLFEMIKFLAHHVKIYVLCVFIKYNSNKRFGSLDR